MAEEQQTIQLSIDTVFNEPWQLMKGRKLYIWKMMIPVFVGLVILLGLSLSSLVPLTAGVEDHVRFGEDGGVIFLCIGGLIFLMSMLISTAAVVIAGCDVAKKLEDRQAWFKLALQRSGPLFVGILIVTCVTLLCMLIPLVGPILVLFFGPVLACYWLLIIYEKGPFSSIPKVFTALKNNYWRMFITVFVVYIVTALLYITLIGIIWAVPFKSIAHGIIYRDLVEPQLKKA